MNDLILVSIGRQFVEFISQREDLIRQNQQLVAQNETLKKQISDAADEEAKQKAEKAYKKG